MPFSATPTPAISVSNLHVAYRGRAVLQGLNLQVAPGSVYALLGGNGAGKSSTLSTLLGFVKPSSGSLLVDGIDPVANPGARVRGWPICRKTSRSTSI